MELKMIINLYLWKIGFLSRNHLPYTFCIDFWKEANGLLKGIVDWEYSDLIFYLFKKTFSLPQLNRKRGLCNYLLLDLACRED